MVHASWHNSLPAQTKWEGISQEWDPATLRYASSHQQCCMDERKTSEYRILDDTTRDRGQMRSKFPKRTHIHRNWYHPLRQHSSAPFCTVPVPGICTSYLCPLVVRCCPTVKWNTVWELGNSVKGGCRILPVTLPSYRLRGKGLPSSDCQRLREKRGWRCIFYGQDHLQELRVSMVGDLRLLPGHLRRK